MDAFTARDYPKSPWSLLGCTAKDDYLSTNCGTLFMGVGGHVLYNLVPPYQIQSDNSSFDYTFYIYHWGTKNSCKVYLLGSRRLSRASRRVQLLREGLPPRGDIGVSRPRLGLRASPRPNDPGTYETKWSSSTEKLRKRFATSVWSLRVRLLQYWDCAWTLQSYLFILALYSLSRGHIWRLEAWSLLICTQIREPFGWHVSYAIKLHDLNIY